MLLSSRDTIVQIEPGNSSVKYSVAIWTTYECLETLHYTSPSSVQQHRRAAGFTRSQLHVLRIQLCRYVCSR
jgi:hypothetical protein